MSTPEARADRLAQAQSLVLLADSLLWAEVAEQCRNGHMAEVSAALGLPRSTVYRRIRQWRARNGVFEDGRKLRSSPDGLLPVTKE